MIERILWHIETGTNTGLTAIWFVLYTSIGLPITVLTIGLAYIFRPK